jgi:hypothetical protein
MKAFQAPGILLRLILLFCLAAMATPNLRAQRPLGDFDVTNGKIVKAAGNRLMVSTSEMRATLKVRTEQNVTLKFTYLGPTKEVAHLGSGEVRSQFGIKLRAQDTCNIVYVMWHFAPDQKIAVSVKRNPGQSTHKECLDHGYINDIKAKVSAPAPAVHVDQPHTLSAAMSGSNLRVTADNKLVWQGDLGPIALEFDGPVGLRSDNAHVVFDFVVNK